MTLELLCLITPCQVELREFWFLLKPAHFPALYQSVLSPPLRSSLVLCTPPSALFLSLLPLSPSPCCFFWPCLSPFAFSLVCSGTTRKCSDKKWLWTSPHFRAPLLNSVVEIEAVKFIAAFSDKLTCFFYWSLWSNARRHIQCFTPSQKLPLLLKLQVISYHLYTAWMWVYHQKHQKFSNCSRSSYFRVSCCENMWRACVRACMWVLNSACVCDSKYSNKQMKAVRDCIHVDRWWDFSHTRSHSECKQQNLNLKLDGKSEFTEMIQIRSTIDMKRSQVKVFLYLWFIGILYANLLLFITNFNKS